MTVSKDGHFLSNIIEQNPCGKPRTKVTSCNSACNACRVEAKAETASTSRSPPMSLQSWKSQFRICPEVCERQIEEEIAKWNLREKQKFDNFVKKKYCIESNIVIYSLVQTN